MPKPHRPWTITPHGPIEKHEDNLWSVEGWVVGAPFKRRMAIVKRSDGTLLFFHAIPLEQAQLDEVLAWGKPAVLVIGHDAHGADADAFAKKLGLKLYGPKKWGHAMRAKWPDLAGDLEDLPADPAVRFEALDGTKKGEPVGIVTSPNGHVSVLFSDAYQDSKNLSFVFNLLGFGNGPKATPLFKLLFATDKKALAAHFQRLAALPGLFRAIPTHGPAREGDVPQVLRTIATRDL